MNQHNNALSTSYILHPNAPLHLCHQPTKSKSQTKTYLQIILNDSPYNNCMLSIHCDWPAASVCVHISDD